MRFTLIENPSAPRDSGMGWYCISGTDDKPLPRGNDATAAILSGTINFSQVCAGPAVGIKEVHDDIWLVSFMDYDLGYFDLDTRVLEPLENPFGPKVSPM